MVDVLSRSSFSRLAARDFVQWRCIRLADTGDRSRVPATEFLDASEAAKPASRIECLL